MKLDKHHLPYQQLIQRISDTSDGQRKAAQAVNTHLLETYWQIG